MNEDKKPKVKELDHWIPPKETLVFRTLSKLLTGLTAVGVLILMYLFNRTKFYGKNIIKKEKAPYIFASNHTTMFDSGFIDCSVFLSKGVFSYNYLPYHTPEYGNFYKNKIMAWYMDHVKCIPVERGKGIDQNAQKIVTQKLKKDSIVHIFPEGTRSRSGDLLSPKAGIGKRIYESKVKVVPCYHEGMRDMLPVGTTFPKMGKKIRVIIGEPIFFDEFFDQDNIPETWKNISQKIMDEIKSLKEKLHELESK